MQAYYILRTKKKKNRICLSELQNISNQYLNRNYCLVYFKIFFKCAYASIGFLGTFSGDITLNTKSDRTIHTLKFKKNKFYFF